MNVKHGIATAITKSTNFLSVLPGYMILHKDKKLKINYTPACLGDKYHWLDIYMKDRHISVAYTDIPIPTYSVMLNPEDGQEPTEFVNLFKDARIELLKCLGKLPKN